MIIVAESRPSSADGRPTLQAGGHRTGGACDRILQEFRYILVQDAPPWGILGDYLVFTDDAAIVPGRYLLQS